MFGIFDEKNDKDDKRERVELDREKFRALILVLGIFVIIGVVVVNLAILMIKDGDYYNKQVLSKRQVSFNQKITKSKRGDILDCDGNVLATSVRIWTLILDPRLIMSSEDDRYINATINAVSTFFDYDKMKLRGIVEERKDRAYVKLIQEISEEDKEKFIEYKDEMNENYKEQKLNDRINGVWFEEEYKRIYPNDSLASNVIGFMNNDDSVMGLELYYDKELKGTNGRSYGILEDNYDLKTVKADVVNGYNIVTTIDSDMQKIVEEKLKLWQEGEIGSKSASAIIMNPNDGEIYAMASTNSFNLNAPRDVSEFTEEEIEVFGGVENIWYDRWKNKCIQDTFEPGSTAKVETMAATIEDNVVNSDIEFDCKGYIELDDGENKWRIRCNNRSGHGKLNLVESLTKSCNMSMALMGEMLGINNFVKYQKTFGFGEWTGIDLPYEADTSKLVYDKTNMGRTTLSTNAFGQNFNCTMIQMITAFSSAINGGSYLTPHIVKRIENENGEVVKLINKNEVRKTISKSTSKFLREALFETVETGTGKLAQIKGRNIGGKTGTAEKLPREAKNYLVSFIGFDDKDDPQLVCYVVVDEPHLEGEKQATATFATTIFHDIMKEVLALEK